MLLAELYQACAKWEVQADEGKRSLARRSCYAVCKKLVDVFSGKVNE